MRWGLVWWTKPLKEMKHATFNARVETVASKPMFRGAFKRNRCLTPANGYYEWEDMPDGKQPHYFTRADGQVITMAGLWDEWKDKESGDRAAVLHDDHHVNRQVFVAEVHDRMPVVLEPDQLHIHALPSAHYEPLRHPRARPACPSRASGWLRGPRLGASRIS